MMAQINGYKEELQEEFQKADPSSHASRLIAQEIERLEHGEDSKEDKLTSFIDIHSENPQAVTVKVRIPAREYPKFNFIGKLLGPKGNTLKRMQDETGCKMAILGKGSMRDKLKEDELRKEGGKYAHLNEELHVSIEAFTEMSDGYRRLALAILQLKKFLTPEPDDEIRQQQMQEMMYINESRGGGHRSRGGGASSRGGSSSGRGSRGSVSGRGSRGAASSRDGTASSRGATARGRGSISQSGSYDDYNYPNSGHGVSGVSSGYDDGYSSRGYMGSGYGGVARGDSQYYGGGGGASYGSSGGGQNVAAGSYDSYSYDGYADNWRQGDNGVGPLKSTRGGVSTKSRSHPYNGASRGAY